MKDSKPYQQLAIFSAIVTLVVILVNFIFPSAVFLFTWILLGYFIGITFLTNFLMGKGTNSDDPYDFYNSTMSSVAIRLLVSAGILFGYYYNVKENQFPFTFTFFILYFLFTGFEIRLQLSKLRQKKGSSDNTNEKV